MLSVSILSMTATTVYAQPGNPASREAMIQNALSAGPISIAADAAVMDYDMSVLRAGTNGWTCFPDSPDTPVNDPMCNDAQWLIFMEAYMTQQTPVITAVGISYMLQGDAVASNDDPFAAAPAQGADWQIDPPHLMIVSPDPALYEGYSRDPNNGGPWIMFAGTPYEHVMIPVAQPLVARE
jgi:hypothetical protein